MNKSIVAVIVTYNRKDILRRCLEAVLSQKDIRPDVLLIDNASSDGTAEMVMEQFGNDAALTYYNTGSNLGGAGGFSVGIRKAVEAGYERLWVMDDDTIPDPDALSALTTADSKLGGKFGFLSGYAYWKDGSPCKMNVPAVSGKWRQNISFEFENGMLRLDTASFVSMFLNTDAVRQVGLPIAEFFIWGDDVEYSRRLSRRFPCYFVFGSKVLHDMKTNEENSIVSADERLERFRYFYRNRYYLARTGDKRTLLFYWAMVKNDIKGIVRKKDGLTRKKLSIVMKGCLSGLFFKPEIDKADDNNNPTDL